MTAVDNITSLRSAARQSSVSTPMRKKRDERAGAGVEDMHTVVGQTPAEVLTHRGVSCGDEVDDHRDRSWR
jgi:hypothetical protein